MCVFMCKCVFRHTQTHTWARVSESMDGICHQPASPGPVCTRWHTRLCLKHFLIKGRWQIIMIYFQITTITLSQVQTLQRYKNINTKDIHINQIIQRLKTGHLRMTTKGCSTQYLWKISAPQGMGRWWNSEDPAPCFRESWVEWPVSLCHCSHTVDAVKHCTEARSRLGPRM